MKIIAKTDENRFMVDISKRELEKLTGYYYDRSKFYIGDTITVDALFEQLDKLNEQEAEIKKMVHSLKTAAGMLEKINPVFSKA